MCIASTAMVVSAIACVPGRAAEVNANFKRIAAGSNKTVDHGAWDSLLRAYVRADAAGVNRVAYARMKGDGQAALKAYLARLQQFDPASLDRPEQMSFWINLYNAKTIDVVLDRYPVKSIKDISLGGGLKALVSGGPWQARIMRVQGAELSLDDVEHGILRPLYADARVHYAVNCASVGCPNLATEAYTGARLEGLLQAGARAFVNSPRGVKVAGDGVTASSIYSWFQSDFGGSETAVIEHLRGHASAGLRQQLLGIGRIDRYDYDWALADAKS